MGIRQNGIKQVGLDGEGDMGVARALNALSIATITKNGVVGMTHRCKWDGMSTWVVGYCRS